MITLTESQRYASQQPATAPATLFTLVPVDSNAIHLSTRPCSWAGDFYANRVRNASPITTGVAGFPYELPPVKSLTLSVANADGYFSRKRPAYWKGQPLTVKEVFTEVDTPARTFGFVMTHTELVSDEEVQIHAEDVLASVRRKLIPSNDVIITNSIYQNLNLGAGPANATGLNQPIPWLFGDTFCPIYYVDQDTYGNHIYVATVGSAVQPGSGSVVDWFDGGFSQIDFPQPTGTTVPWSVRYAVRSAALPDGTVTRIPVTEVYVDKLISPDDPIARRFARLGWGRGIGTAADSFYTTPDEVLVWMFRDCFAGAHISPTLIDSDSLLSARSFYLANSICFDGALIEQRPLEDWLVQWQHDAMTRLILRDKIYLAPCDSRAAVSSFCDANILPGTLRFTDVPLAQEGSRRKLFFRHRVTDADYGPGDDSQGENARGGTFVRFDAGSGAEEVRTSPFIGRQSVASRVNQYWAKHAYFGQRRYELTSTVKQIALEEGDLVTLTNSLVGCQAQPCEVLGITRRGGVLDFTLIETDTSTLWVANVPVDPPFRRLYQFISHGATNSYAVGQGYPDYTVITSHQLTTTPRTILVRGVAPYLTIVVSWTANNSEASITNRYIWPGPLQARDVFLGWYLYA